MGRKLCVYESGLPPVMGKLCMSIMNRSKKEIYIYRDFQEKRGNL